MSISRPGSTLVILLFPVFENPEARRDFEMLLGTALTVTTSEIRVLEFQERYTPIFVHTFLKEQTRLWDGPIALICFTGQDSLLQAASKIGTIDQFIPPMRSARKVLVTGPNVIDKPCAYGHYPSHDDTGVVNKPLLMMRTGPPPYPMTVVRELAHFLGKPDRPRAPTDQFLATRKRRDDETQQGFPIEDPKTGKVVGFRQTDPAEEDERPTMEPPPPSRIPSINPKR